MISTIFFGLYCAMIIGSLYAIGRYAMKAQRDDAARKGRPNNGPS